MNKEKNWFDLNASNAIKGLGIVLMVFHHCFRKKELYEGFTISFYPFSESLIIDFAIISKICVSLFAFISGYGLYLNYKNKKGSLTTTQWILIREVKLLSNFWFVFIFSCIICQIINQIPEQCYFKNGIEMGLINIVIEFFGLAGLFGTETLNLTWWYISAAVVYIFCVPIIVKNENNFFSMFMFTIFFPRIINVGYFGDNSLYSFFLIFLLGCISARYNLINNLCKFKNKSILKFFIEIILFSGFVLIYNKIPNEIFCELKWCFFPFLVIIFFVEFVIDVPFINQTLILLGKHSMNIYLIHSFLRAIYLKKFLYSLHHFILVIICLILISLFISIIMEKINQLIRYQNFINLILKRINNNIEKNAVKQ